MRRRQGRRGIRRWGETVDRAGREHLVQRRQCDRQQERCHHEVPEIELPGALRRLGRVVGPADQPPPERLLGDPQVDLRDSHGEKHHGAHAERGRKEKMFPSPQNQGVPHGCAEQDRPREPHDDISRGQHRPDGDEVHLSDEDSRKHWQPPFTRPGAAKLRHHEVDGEKDEDHRAADAPGDQPTGRRASGVSPAPPASGSIGRSSIGGSDIAPMLTE